MAAGSKRDVTDTPPKKVDGGTSVRLREAANHIILANDITCSRSEKENEERRKRGGEAPRWRIAQCHG
jgi:hypothetical protein